MAPLQQAKQRETAEPDKDAVVMVTNSRISPSSLTSESSDALSQDERSSPTDSTSSSEHVVTGLLNKMDISSQQNKVMYQHQQQIQMQQVPIYMPPVSQHPYYSQPPYHLQQQQNMVPMIPNPQFTQARGGGGAYEMVTNTVLPMTGWQCLPPPSQMSIMQGGGAAYIPPPPQVISMAPPPPVISHQQLSPHLYSPVPLLSPCANESLTYQPNPHQQQQLQCQVLYRAPPTCCPTYPPPQSAVSTDTRYPPVDTGSCDPLSLSQRMDVVWNSKFIQLFSSLLGTWSFDPIDEPLPPNSTSHVLVDHAKVRFLCRECASGWTSMKGRVVFWINFEPSTGVGQVMFKLYGQTCKRCLEKRSQLPASSSAASRPLEYQHSMWYVEEVHKVLENLYQKIGELYYGFPSTEQNVKKDCRPGKPRKPHDKNLCQACKDGVCRPQH